MKKIIFSTLAMLVLVTIHAQNFEELPSIKMKVLKDYENNELVALKCAEYLLSNELDFEEENRLYATQFILRWMTGTDITFTLGDDFLKYSDGNEGRTQIYIASLVYAALENPDTELSDEAMNKEAADVFLKYCAEHSTIKKNKAIKQELKNYPKE